MKLILISAITASVFVTASPSPTFAQSTPAKAAEQAAVLAAGPDANAAIVVAKDARAVVPDNASVATVAVVDRARPFDSLIATHASSNGVPAELVHRIIVRESRYRAGSVGRGGATGLMQIKLATARGMGYTGTAAGLLDPDTNLAYGVKYLAGAYRAAGGHQARAVGYYASGYYHAAKRQRVAPANAFAQAETAPTLFAPGTSAEPEVLMRHKVRHKHRPHRHHRHR